MISAEFNELLPRLSDEELDSLDRALERLTDAQQAVSLLSHELVGALSLLKEAHND